MVMDKRIFIIAALACSSFLPGCGKVEQKRPPVAGSPHGGAVKADEYQAPYYPGLIEEYKTLLAEDPNNLAAIIAIGNAYFDSGQWKKAITYYEHALRIDPRNADVRTDMGTSYRNQGMSERALAEYRMALKHEPGHLNARYNTGVVYAYDKKDYVTAVHVWEELLRLSPNYPKSGHMRTCIVTFKKVIEKGNQ